MPTPKQLGYSSIAEFLQEKKRLEGLLQAERITQEEFDNLLGSTKVDVETFIEPRLVGAPAIPVPPAPVARTTLPTPPRVKKLTQQAETSTAVGKAAAKETETRPAEPYPDVFAEELETIQGRVGGPRTIGGKKTSGAVLGRDKEPGGFAEALSRQEVLFPDDRKAMEESGLLGTAMSRVFFTEDPEGRIVESYPVWLGRVLGASSEALASAVESSATGEEFNKVFQRRLKKGEGLSGAAYELTDAFSDATGLPPEVVGPGLFITGFIGDLLMPTIPFAGQAARAVKIAGSGAKVFSKLAGKVGPVATLVEDFLMPLIEGADNAAKRGVLRFSTNKDNISSTKLILTEGLADHADAAAKLGVSGGSLPKLTEAAFLDAFERAGKLENGTRLQQEMFDFYQSLPASVKGKTTSTAVEEAMTTFANKVELGERMAPSAELAKAAEDLVSSSFLRLGAQKQIADASAYVLSKNPDIIAGGYAIPAREFQKISDRLAEIARPSEIATSVFVDPKKPILLADETIAGMRALDNVVPMPKLKGSSIKLEDWNNWVNSAIEQLVKENPTARLASEAKKEGSAVVDVLTTAGKALPEPVKAPFVAMSKFATDVKELATKVSPELKAAAEAEKLTPAQRQILQKAQRNLGSIDDEMKAAINKGISEGKTRQQAYTDAILEGYTKSKLAGAGDEAIKATTQQADLFDDFLATIFGAEEKVVQASKTLLGSTMRGVDPIAFRKNLAEIAGKTNLYSELKKEFDTLLEAGDSKAVIEFLGKVHKSLEGRTLGDLGVAVDKARDIEVAIPSSRYLDALNFTYINRRASDIASDALDEMGGGYVAQVRKRGVDALRQAKEAILSPAKLPTLTFAVADQNTIRRALAGINFDKAFTETIKRVITKDLSVDEIKVLGDKIADKFVSKLKNVDPADLSAIKKEFSQSLAESLQLGATRVKAIATGEVKVGGVPGPTIPIPYGITGSPLNQKELLDEMLKLLVVGEDVKRSPAQLARVLKNTEVGRIFFDNLQSSRNLAQAGRSLETLKTIPRTIVADVNVNRSLGDVVRQIRELELSGQPLTERAKKTLASLLSREGAEAAIGSALGKAGTLIKQGMLAGAIAPNFAYHAQNILTAPLIINSTLGGKRAIQALGDLAFLDPRVNASVDALFGFRPTQGVSKLLDATIKTPSGKVYDPDAIAKLIAENGVAQAREMVDLSRNVLEDFAKWSGKNLKGQDVSKARQFVREFNPTKPNVWFEVANYFDTRFRTGVLVRALSEGKTEEEAIRLARESLFDYTKIPQAEKDILGKFIWFYSFERASITQAVKNLLTNPKAYVAEQRVKNLMREDEEVHSAISDYRDNSMFLGVLEDGKEDYYLYGPSMPQADGLARLTDYLGALQGLLSGDVETAAKTALGRASASSALTLPLAALGYEINRGEISDPTNYVDPRILGWIREVPQLEEQFKTYVKLEPIPEEDITDKNITLDGKAYRIRFGDERSRKNYNRIMELAKTIGQERAIRDYSQVIVGDKEGEFTPGALEVDDKFVEFLRSIGLVKVEPAKTGEEIRSGIREQIIRETK